jgi:hypothetical protein
VLQGTDEDLSDRVPNSVKKGGAAMPVLRASCLCGGVQLEINVPLVAPSASACLAIVVTKASGLCFLVSSRVASGLIDAEERRKTASHSHRLMDSPRPA